MNELKANSAGSVELQIFEKSHRNLLAVPMTVAAGTHVVIELFDKPGGFSADDQHTARSAADLGTELMRQALGQRQTHQLLFDAVAAALRASEQMAASLHGVQTPEKPPELVLQQLRAGLKDTSEDAAAAETSLRLAEAIRALASKHGQPALEHCLALVEQRAGIAGSGDWPRLTADDWGASSDGRKNLRSWNAGGYARVLRSSWVPVACVVGLGPFRRRAIPLVDGRSKGSQHGVLGSAIAQAGTDAGAIVLSCASDNFQRPTWYCVAGGSGTCSSFVHWPRGWSACSCLRGSCQALS